MSISSGGDDTRVEISVKGLTGINYRGSRRKDGKFNIPLLSATVTFSGSAAEMKVGSSSVCGLTGQLLVESEPLIFDRPASKVDHCWLSASWNEDILPGMIPRPHLSMSLPERHADSPGVVPLAKANKGSRIVTGEERKRPISDLSVSRSFATDHTKSTRTSKTRKKRGLSPKPSASSEIIELFIRLRSEEEESTEHLWQGVSYLVVFGHEADQGTHLIEVPVRRPSYEEMKNDPLGDLVLASDAKLLLQVTVVLPEKIRQSPVSTRRQSCQSKNANSIVKSHKDLQDCPSITDSQMEPLLAMIVSNEKVALEHYKTHQKLSDIKDVQTSSGCACDGIWTLSRIFKTINTVVQQCDGSGQAVDPATTPSVCSTIETRDSLNI